MIRSGKQINSPLAQLDLSLSFLSVPPHFLLLIFLLYEANGMNIEQIAYVVRAETRGRTAQLGYFAYITAGCNRTGIYENELDLKRR